MSALRQAIVVHVGLIEALWWILGLTAVAMALGLVVALRRGLRPKSSRWYGAIVMTCPIVAMGFIFELPLLTVVILSTVGVAFAFWYAEGLEQVLQRGERRRAERDGGTGG